MHLLDLLSARSGVYHAAANGGDDASAAPARGSQKPGSYFLYNNWDFNAAGTVFEQLTGRSIYRSFADDLATPLALEDFDLARHKRSGNARLSQHLAYPFFLSTRDMARLGYLMLKEGNWRGQQLIPADWVSQMTQQRTPSTDMHPPHTARRGFGYGLPLVAAGRASRLAAERRLHGLGRPWPVHPRDSETADGGCTQARGAGGGQLECELGRAEGLSAGGPHDCGCSLSLSEG